MGRGTRPSIVPIAVLLILLSHPSLADVDDQRAEERDIEILRTLPHDPSSFTQGLEVLESSIFESSGLYGHSRISEIDSQNGDIIRQIEVDDSYFAEGITVRGDSIIMLTWRAGVDFFSSPSSVTSIQGESHEEVLNGIAFDNNSGGFWITGKNWTHMYLVNFISPEGKSSLKEDSLLSTSMAFILATILSSVLILRATRKKEAP